jgi:putative hydrolase of the HAD superfamily
VSLDLVRAITLDLDDTLWPVRPTLVAAEQVLNDWLRLHAPRTAAAVGPRDMLKLRAQVALEHPEWSHDLSAIRLETISRALRSQDEDPALAVPAFEAFFHARHRVVLYDDVRPGLARLAARYRLVAVSNGNAELHRVGLDDYFSGSVSARLHGVAKPDASIFHAACDLLGHRPHEVLHLGDDLEMDVAGALAAGLQGGWIHRDDSPMPEEALRSPIHAGAHRWTLLTAAADALGC